MPQALRMAIIGTGNWSRHMHLPSLKKLAKLEDVVFAGVCDLNAEAARAYAKDLGAAESFTDLNRMIEALKPDGVALLVPPEVVGNVLGQVIARRVPFIVEKPPAPDAATQRRLIREAEGLTHVVAYNRRHCPYITQAKEWLAGIAPQSVTTQFTRFQRREEDFTTTAVHGIDATRHLASEDLVSIRLEVAQAGPVKNFFLNGWTKAGTRVDMVFVPDTASSCEHYEVRAQERTVLVSFPQNGMIDLPGYVELHEKNKVAVRKGPADFGFAPDDQPGLGGILAEHQVFCRSLQGQAKPFSTLTSTLQTQEIRDALYPLMAQGGRAATELVFTS
jgi:predicted dehydrogenase